MYRAILATIVFAWLFSCAASGDTIYVNGAAGDDTWDGLCEEWDGGTCGPKATIQAGIDVAGGDDEVVVADGTYTGVGNKDLDFGGKDITVRSQSGDPATCIIDCEGDGRGFYFHTDEGSDSVVDGFTITNGATAYGAAVYCSSSSPTINNCAIRGNASTIHYGCGGGVYCHNGASPATSNCLISDNWAPRGGGVYSADGSPTFTNCEINANSAEDMGGGVCCGGVSPAFINCTISNNWSEDIGGGVFCGNGSQIFTNCTIANNLARYEGGGIYCDYHGNATISNCAITENQ